MQKIEFQNKYFKFGIGLNGKILSFTCKKNDKDYCDGKRQVEFARIRLAGRDYPARKVQAIDGGVRLSFEDVRIQTDIKVVERDHCLIFEVTGVSNPEVEELLFVNAYLNLQGTPEDDFAACALALNLKTNVPEMPGLNHRLRATAYRKFGITGAKVAVIGCPGKDLRSVIKEVVGSAEELPHSPVGGAWALDTAMSKGSFFFDTGDISERNVEEWIAFAKSLGFTQIDFHGGKSFRFGDCEVDPELYPRGWDSFKAVIDKLHAAGIAAILHTYSFCIDKPCVWVTPVPDRQLASDAVFTLADSIDAESDLVPVVESVESMSATDGAYLPEAGILQNSLVLRVDDELIIYAGVKKEAPYAFTRCERGALGTRKALHPKDAKVHHMKECFRRFVPDGESALFTEVAKRTADFYNYCGFDMIYLDALDGETVFSGREYGWHYGAKFSYELFRRLKKPALMEMATFHHHLWHLRSRIGAWDHPFRGFKRFIDCHVASNTKDQRIFMPGHLGWWAMKIMSWHKIKVPTDVETQFTDDIEYLCGKALATDTGFALMGIDPEGVKQNATLRQKAGIIRRYEELRQSGNVSEEIKAKLRRAGIESALTRDNSGQWQLRQVEYIKRKTIVNSIGNQVEINNNYDRQPLQMRLELLSSAGAYESQDNIIRVRLKYNTIYVTC